MGISEMSHSECEDGQAGRVWVQFIMLRKAHITGHRPSGAVLPKASFSVA